MTNERAMELLNQIIEYTLIARNIYEGINKLISMGFEKEELEKYFNFSGDDIGYALEESNH